MIALLYLFFILFFTYSFLLLFFSINRKDKLDILPNELPIVSVLVAARNEEENILSCLKALEKLDYPKDKLECLIGNDRSEDNTLAIIDAFIKGKNNFKVITITDNLGTAKGKANVLAHLARESKGDFLFITDADIEVPNTWIKGLLSRHDKGDGIVSGVTIVEGESLFSKLQGIEWIYAFGMVKIVSDLNIPVSAVGNNMMISKEAYLSTGGYENIPFSVTEDFELFRQTLKRGWRFKNLQSQDVLAFSKPIKNWRALFHQRKRWLTGARNLPLVLSTCLFLQSIFLPVILLTWFIQPWVGIVLWGFKILLKQVFIGIELKRLNLSLQPLKYFLLFEIYTGLFSIALLLYHILPTKINWKGRKY
jgi:cellulose synthase/poly-beta-1,6-N-acetylglucosamine synthase-like glycosyltransferase